MISKRTNSEIGSHHWFMTILSSILHISEYLQLNDVKSEKQHKWMHQIHNDSEELVNGFHLINKGKINISFTGTEIENKEAFADAMSTMIQKAFENSKLETE